MPRVKDVTKTKKKKKKKKLVLDEQSDDETNCEKQETSKVRHVVHSLLVFSLEMFFKNLFFYKFLYVSHFLQPDESRHKESDKECVDENIHYRSNGATDNKKKKKKKRKTKRNKTSPTPDGNDSDTGVVLKPISAWRTPPASLNGFPGNGRKLEPIRPPLHNSEYWYLEW